MSPQLRNLFRLFLPAILIAVVYWAFMSRTSGLSDARARHKAILDTSPSPDAVAAEGVRVQRLEARVSQLKAENLALETEWSKLGGQIVPAATTRAKSLRQFSQMLWKKGLYEVERSPSDGAGAKLPQSLSDMVQTVSGNNGDAKAKLWSIKFYGRYADVMSLLKTLRTENSEGRPIMLPVGVTMAETNDRAEDWRVWTLVLWM